MKQLDQAAREFQKTEGLLLRRDFSLFQRDFKRDAQAFIADVESAAKKAKQSKVTLLAIIYD
jgi:hypothetical protein